MKTTMSFWLLFAMVGASCTGSDKDLDLCAQCLSGEGPCAEGCCAIKDDPLLLCQEYVFAVCERSRTCAPSTAADLPFCTLDCGALNACEMIALVAFPDERRACLESLAGAVCDPDEAGVWFEATASCQTWKELVNSALHDSVCHQNGGGQARIEQAL